LNAEATEKERPATIENYNEISSVIHWLYYVVWNNFRNISQTSVTIYRTETNYNK
jgi:hypothetical protein